MFFFLIVCLIIALLLEGTVTTIPLVLIVLLCLTIQRRDGIVFPIAFAAGIILDIMTIRMLGASSIFFIIMIFMILLYQRKYEINSYPFVFFAAFLGSVTFLLLLGNGGWFWQASISSFSALVLFGLMRHRVRRKERGNLGYKSV